jgi:cobalt-precorrin 5A hydrolase/precorrin-3B C17-methyltransferase
MKAISISVTRKGYGLAERLAYEHLHGDVAVSVRRAWHAYDAIILVMATGAAVRVIAPLLCDKSTDPAVISVDDTGRYVIALTGGHAGGGNALARRIAAVLGAEPVVTTATDSVGLPALDLVPGMPAEGDVAGVTRSILDGSSVQVDNPLGWRLPLALEHLVASDGTAGSDAGAGMVNCPPRATQPLGAPPSVEARIVVTDSLAEHGRPGPMTVVLRPPSLVAGVGTSLGAPPDEVSTLLDSVMRGAGLAPESLVEVATIDRRRHEPAVVALGRQVVAFRADELRGLAVPNPSEVVTAAVGTPSVAEAAALLAAGPGASLVVTKQSSPHATVAIARRAGPKGILRVIGLGPGGADSRTQAAERALLRSEAIVGYEAYVEQCADLIAPYHQVVRSPIGSEMDRVRQAAELAAGGRRVALVCSGDPGVYAMASPVLELLATHELQALVDVEIVPGVTAALAASAALGAPLGHDHASISLSDLLTPWEVIEQRVEYAAQADMVIAFYNPRSRRRNWQLERAREILLAHRAASTPVGIVTDAARPGQTILLGTLEDFDVDLVSMTSCVIVGSSTTRVAGDRMFTPRGYQT